MEFEGLELEKYRLKGNSIDDIEICIEGIWLKKDIIENAEETKHEFFYFSPIDPTLPEAKKYINHIVKLPIEAVKFLYKIRDVSNYYKDLVNEGKILRSHGEIKKAINNFKIAINIEPQVEEAYINLGNAYDDLEDYENAILTFEKALEEYRISLETFPSRLVLHKTSNFTDDEIEGFNKAIKENKISNADFITVLKSNIRLLRDGNYPPRRGTLLTISEKQYIFYTRGAVEYFKTYAGKYVPQPLDIRIFRCDSSIDLIISEILALTKMNWNNTQFDRKYPITIESAKKVGDIMKYIPKDKTPEIRYSFYM